MNADTTVNDLASESVSQSVAQIVSSSISQAVRFQPLFSLWLERFVIHEDPEACLSYNKVLIFETAAASCSTISIY